MAYVLQFAPQAFVNVPRHGTIQYHPSLLPRYRGPSSVNWPIIRGETRTGLTIFRPSDGLDEGPVILQKDARSAPTTRSGASTSTTCFRSAWALLEAADLVVRGEHRETVQDEALATYEGWCRDPEARINWHAHVDQVYDLIRGCNPAPGAWTTVRGRKVRLYDAAKHRTRTFSAVAGKPGEITAIGADTVDVALQGGRLELRTVRLEDGQKLSAGELARSLQLAPGVPLESDAATS